MFVPEHGLQEQDGISVFSELMIHTFYCIVFVGMAFLLVLSQSSVRWYAVFLGGQMTIRRKFSYMIISMTFQLQL